MMSNRKHGRFVSRFEPLALHLRLHRNEGFHYARSYKIIQEYKFPQELLDLQVPHSVPQPLHSQARKARSEAATPTASNTMNTW